MLYYIRETVITMNKQFHWYAKGAASFVAFFSLALSLYQPLPSISQTKPAASSPIQPTVTPNQIPEIYRTNSGAVIDPEKKSIILIESLAKGKEKETVQDGIKLAAWHENIGKGIKAKQAGAYLQAELDLAKALELAKEIGVADKRILLSEVFLAGVYMHLKKNTEAIKLYKDALKIAETTKEADEQIATILDNLSLAYANVGNYKAAKELNTKALSIYEQKLGPKSIDYAICLGNQAQFALDQKKYKEAESVFRKQIAILEPISNRRPGILATAFDNLAATLFRKNELAEAEKYRLTALELYRQELGNIHPETGICLNNLGVLHMAAGKPVQAKEDFSEALRILKKSFGLAHPTTMEVQDRLIKASAECEQGSAPENGAP